MRGRPAWAVAAAILLAGAAAAQEGEELPKIFLEKKILTEDRQGKRSFYEVHTVTEGENLWKILRRASGSDASGPDLLKEFLRANPEVTDPGRLRPGQKILVPTVAPARQVPAEALARTVPRKVVKGDRLIRILSARGVSRQEMTRYLSAVREVNPSIRDVNRIIAGSTIRIPTPDYFEPAVVAQAPPPQAAPPSKPEEPAPKPEAPPAAVAQLPPPQAAPAVTREEPVPKPEPPPSPRPPEGTPSEGPALTRAPDVAPPPGGSDAARPDAQLAPTPRPVPEEGLRSRPGARPPEAPSPPAPKPPYRGLLMDVVRSLGETWQNRGTLYLPVASGGEVVLNLEEFPVVRFGTGRQVLVDFGGRLDAAVRDLITGTWPSYRVVSMEDLAEPAAMIGRLLAAAGYHSVKDGTARPLVIGEALSVELPARFVVLKTEKSLLSGEVILVKEVPERPPAELAAVIAYAERIGIRILPFAADPSAREGFLVGVDAPAQTAGATQLAVPAGALPAVDFALEYLGLAKGEGQRLQIGGAKGAYLLTVQPDRIFEAKGKKVVVDAGRMSRPILALVRESGYETISLRRDETGISAFRRVLSAAGIETGDRRGHLLSGGEGAGYAVRLSGALVLSPELLERRKARAAALVRGKVHAATDAMLRDLGVEIVGW